MKLFIYGTLKRGHSRAGALKEQRFLGEAQTVPKYRMVDCGDYPGLVAADEGVSIAGELWEVDQACLDMLDELEGVSLNLFRRAAVELQPPYRNEEVVVYFYQGNTVGLPDCGACF